MTKSTTACFTGHRPQKLPWKFNENDERCLKMKKTLRIEIENAINRGYDTFLCGMAIGFDMIALFDGQSGGTQSTIDYAKKQGLHIVVIKP